MVNRRVDDVNQHMRDGFQAVNQHVDDVSQRIDDLRQDVQANRIFQNSRVAVAVAALASGAVIGTFVLQLIEAVD